MKTSSIPQKVLINLLNCRCNMLITLQIDLLQWFIEIKITGNTNKKSQRFVPNQVHQVNRIIVDLNFSDNYYNDMEISEFD